MDSFREYKSFKSEWKSKKRIPILRVLFVLILLYAGYASGTFYKAYSAVENFFRHEEKQGGQVSGHPASFFNLPPPFFSDQPYKL